MKIKRLLAPFLLSLLATLPSGAQGPTDPTLHDFEPDGEYGLVVDGQPVPDAEILRAGHVPAYLILSQAFATPVLLLPRESAVRGVALDKLIRRGDGLIDLRAGAVETATALGALTVDGENGKFQVNGRSAGLVVKPALVGLHTATDIERYNVSFARRAQRYTPNAEALKTLRAAKGFYTVHVVFGSWCPHCQQKLPGLLRAEHELKGAPITFEYFGLPKPPAAWTDAEAKRLGVTAVPLAVVLRDGQEIGRILSGAWDTPEVVLSRIVATAPPATR